MKIWKKVIQNKIAAKAALAAASIAVIASVMGEEKVDAYTKESVLQEQDGVVIVWEWNKISNTESIRDFIRESYYNPCPVLLAPYNTAQKRISGQPISLYADSDHMKKLAYRSSNVPIFCNTVFFHMTDLGIYSFENRGLTPTETAAYKAFYSANLFDKCGEIDDRFLDYNHICFSLTNSKFDNRSMFLVSDNENEILTSQELQSDKFYTGGNCRGCFWVTSTSPSAYPDRLYDSGYSADIILTLSNPETKTKMSESMRQESFIQKTTTYGSNDIVNNSSDIINSGIPSKDYVISAELSKDFASIHLDDTGVNDNGLWKTYLGAYTAPNASNHPIYLKIHYDSKYSSDNIMPVSICGTNNAKWQSGGVKAEFGGSALGAGAYVSDAPSGATFLAYDNGLLYGYNAYAGKYTLYGKSVAKVLWGEITISSQSVDINSKIEDAAKMAREAAAKKGYNFTTSYAMYYGKEYIFTAFKGETNEVSSDGRPTTVISGIRTVGATTYEDENGGVIKTEGEILCEGQTIEIPQGAVLSVDGNFVNNGKIVINGGTLIIKDGGTISQLGDTNEGCIICNQGDSGESGQIIVMPGGKMLCTSFINVSSLENGVKRANDSIRAGGIGEVTVMPGLILNQGASLVNYGTVVCSTMVLDANSVIEERKGSSISVGFCNKDGFIFFAHEKDHMKQLETTDMEKAKDEILKDIIAMYSYCYAIEDTDRQKILLQAKELVEKYYQDFKILQIKGEGKPIILKEDSSDEVRGFDENCVTIKTTEY